MQELHPFVVPMFIIDVQDWENKKKTLLSLPDWDASDCMNEDNFTDYHKHKTKPPYMQEFLNIIETELKEFAQKIDHSIGISALWAQRYKRNQYMGPHNHGPLGYSAILYVEFDADEHNGTQFFAPYNNFLHGNTLDFTPDVKEGQILFFPSTLLHHALASRGDKLRTIFSMNIKATS